jgi:hypothetical protein
LDFDDSTRADVVEVLEQIGRRNVFPSEIRVDPGAEFGSRDLEAASEPVQPRGQAQVRAPP